MTVIFSTDSSVSNGGFTADYSSDEAAGEREELLFSDFFSFCFGGLISLVNLCPFGSVWWDTHWTWKLHLTWLWHWKLQQQPELWMADPEPASYEFLHCGYYRRAPSRGSPNLWAGLLGVQTGYDFTLRDTLHSTQWPMHHLQQFDSILKLLHFKQTFIPFCFLSVPLMQEI